MPVISIIRLLIGAWQGAEKQSDHLLPGKPYRSGERNFPFGRDP
jgi:hypothetical protein